MAQGPSLGVDTSFSPDSSGNYYSGGGTNLSGYAAAASTASQYIPGKTGSVLGSTAGMAAAGAAVGGPVGAVVGGAVGFLGSMFSKGGDETQQEQGMTIPYEMERSYTEYMLGSMQMLSQDYNRFATAATAYQGMTDALIESNKNNIPRDEAMRTVTDNQMILAQMFQGDAAAAIANGFMDADTAKYMGLVDAEGKNLRQELSALESAEFKDPTLERDLQKQKADLEQRLQRAGASPAARAQALREFEQGATESRFQRSEELKTGKTSRLISGAQSVSSLYGQAFNTGMQGKQFNLNQATTGFNMGQQAWQMGQSAISGQANLVGQGYNMQQQTYAVGAAARQEMGGYYDKAGQFAFSKQAKDYISKRFSGMSAQDIVNQERAAMQAKQQKERDRMKYWEEYYRKRDEQRRPGSV